MSYKVRLRRQARNFIDRLPPRLRERVVESIYRLAEDPDRRDLDVKRLKGRAEYRLRVGDYRVIYQRFNDRLLILIVRVRSRGDAYKE